MRKVYSASTLDSASLIRILLEGHGIPATTESLPWGAEGYTPVIRGISICVLKDEDYDEARRIIAEHQPEPTDCPNCGYDLTGLPEPRCPECGESFHRRDKGPPWNCPSCNEEIEGQFTACWKCGYDKLSETTEAER